MTFEEFVRGQEGDPRWGRRNIFYEAARAAWNAALDAVDKEVAKLPTPNRAYEQRLEDFYITAIDDVFLEIRKLKADP